MYNCKLAAVGRLIDGRYAMLLLSASRRFGYWCATANQRVRADWLVAVTQCFFLVWSMATTPRYFKWAWVNWSTAETRFFFSWLVDGLANYMWWGVSVRGRTDWRRQHDAFSWYDQRRQHKATSSGLGWTDWRQRHDASFLGWSTVWLLTCDSKSACVGGLINGATQCFFSVWSMAVTQCYFPWLVDGGREHWPLAWWDRQNSDARRNKTLYKCRNTSWIYVGKYSDWNY